MMEDIHPYPECMMPDGADPCAGYHAALAEIKRLRQRITGLAIENAEQKMNSSFFRCCALSGETPKDGAEPYPPAHTDKE